MSVDCVGTIGVNGVGGGKVNVAMTGYEGAIILGGGAGEEAESVGVEVVMVVAATVVARMR